MEDRSNAGRTLDAIAGDIHRLECAKIFDIGALLVEAEKACEHGEWRKWLKNEFEWSHDTARNYMNAARLVANDERVRHLRVPATIIYALADDVDDITPKLIDALVEATAGGKRLSVSDADSIIIPTAQRIKYGNYPEAALAAMADVDGGEPWSETAIAALKEERPTTDEEAEAIVRRVEAAYDADEESADDEDDEADGDRGNADDGAASAEPDGDDDDADPAAAAKRRSSSWDRNARQIFLKDCNDAAISAEAYEGPIDEEVLRACRAAADAWAALADELEAAASAKEAA
jgi:hypothetical protein